MIRASSPRFGGSRGISNVIGTIFLVLVVFVVSSNIFLYTMTQNALYNQTVKESHQMDQDRFSERVVASHASYAVLPPDTVVVDVTISNQGPLAAQVITMWVAWTDGDVKKYGYKQGLDIGLAPAGEKVSPTISVVVPGVQLNGTFSGWLVTARGNLVALEKQKTVVQAEVSAGIGSITMNFTKFKYYEVEDNVLKDFPQGKSAFKVPTGEAIVFAVYLSNYDPEERTISLHSNSLLWVYFYVKAGSRTWQIVNLERIENRTVIAKTYTPVILGYGHGDWIYFYSSKSLESGLSGDNGAVNLLLNGELGGQEYGQNIPFVSIYVE